VIQTKLTETIKLSFTREQEKIIHSAMDEYIRAVNETVSLAIRGIDIRKFSSKDIRANLPSAVRAQIAQDARSIIKKHRKECHKAVLQNKRLIAKGSPVRVTAPHLPVLKKPCCYWNNQNFVISKDTFSTEDTIYLSVPVLINGKSERIRIKTFCTEEQYDTIKSHKLGTLRIVSKNSKLIAQVSIEEAAPELLPDNKVMGIDLGIKCPAVSFTSDGKVKFYGNGRHNKYMRRHYKYLRKKLQQKKKMAAVKRINNKEQRIMKDIDHKISRSVVNEAIKQGVSTIKLEQLANIRTATRQSRKNNPSLHTWSFYRLAMYIEYKARLAGIQVAYVNPSYTSQKCPKCGSLNHAKDRWYGCSCGYHTHRDIVGARNICASTEIVGNRLSA